MADRRQWEYTSFRMIVSGDNMITQLNLFGREGWELAATYTGFFFFKRLV